MQNSINHVNFIRNIHIKLDVLRLQTRKHNKQFGFDWLKQ